MKKTMLIVALLPMVAIAIFYLTSRPGVRTPDRSTTAILRSAAPNQGAREDKLKALASKTTDPASAHQTVDTIIQIEAELKQSDAEIKETGRKLAENFNSELRQKAVDAYLERHTPLYSSLFAGWSLGTKDRDEVMGIIREREIALTELRAQLYRNLPNSAKSFVAKRQMIVDRAHNLIRLKIGSDRADELARLETSFLASR